MFISIEAVHLSENLTDTNDIQTIRGGSILMERLADDLVRFLLDGAYGLKDISKIIYGGNRVQLSCEADKDVLNAQVEAFCQTPPYCHLSLRSCVHEDQDFARKVAKHELYSDWTIPPTAPFFAPLPDRLDHFRPAVTKDYGPGGGVRYLSERSILFRDIGRQNRINLEVTPPQSLHDMIASPPDDISQHAVSKIAVVYADGSGFGGLHRKNIDVSSFMADRRAELGHALTKWVKAGGEYTQCTDTDGAHRSRFDILMWGGDDMTFVMPSWCLFDFLQVFFPVVDGWGREEGLKITHRLSAIVANYKSPIRLIRRLAYTGQSQLKGAVEAFQKAGTAKSSVFSVDVFESNAPPFDDLLSYRRSIYGDGYRPEDDAFVADGASQILNGIRSEITEGQDGVGVSITQIHKILEQLHKDKSRICSPGAAEEVRSQLESYLSRTNRTVDLNDAFGLRPLPVTLAKIAELYPYVSHLLEGGNQHD